jgi:hypothetical protein
MAILNALPLPRLVTETASTRAGHVCSVPFCRRKVFEGNAVSAAAGIQGIGSRGDGAILLSPRFWIAAQIDYPHRRHLIIALTKTVRVLLEGPYLWGQTTDSAGIVGADKKVDGFGAEIRQIRGDRKTSVLLSSAPLVFVCTVISVVARICNRNGTRTRAAPFEYVII